MKKIYLLTTVFVLVSFFNLNAQNLLANYPLVSNGTDITGNNPNLTISHAPFQNDGIYSNGIYNGTDTLGSNIQSPQIVNFNFDDLTIKVDFLIEEYPESDEPIIMAGTSWRWLSAWMDGDKIALKAADGINYQVSDVSVSLNQWHILSISYNQSDAKAKLYMDGTLVLSIDVVNIEQSNDAQITNSDGGIGKTFKGYWRNLSVYNSSAVAGVENTLMHDIIIKSNGNRVTVDVPVIKNVISLKLYDLSGKNIGNFQLKKGANSFEIPQTDGIVIFEFNNNKGDKLVRKLYVNN